MCFENWAYTVRLILQLNSSHQVKVVQLKEVHSIERTAIFKSVQLASESIQNWFTLIYL